ncbi:putative Magnetosome protein MamD [Gammaproteobacteria bacterium]
MASETLILKLSGAAQGSQAAMLSGQSFVVGKTIGAGNGLGNWLFLHPLACAGSVCGPSGGGMIALKLEGAQQAGLLSSMVGQTVTVGQSPVAGAANSWLVLHPYMGMGGAAGKGMATVGMAAKGGGLQQVAIRTVEAAEVEGTKTAVASTAAKNGLGKAALAGSTKGTTATVGALSKGSTAVTGPSLVAGTVKTGTSVAAKASAAGATTGGTIWTASGTKLGLGLGLGALGPLLLVGVASAIGVGIYSYMQRPAAEDEITEAVS